MNGITVLVVPTLALWIVIALAIVKIAQNFYYIWLLKRGKRKGAP